MKKIFVNTKTGCTSIFMFLLIVSCFAQDKKLEFGIEGGPNISVIYPVNGYTKIGIGFKAGVSFGFNFSKIFSLRTNISFERKVATYDAIQFADEEGMFWGTVKGHTNYDYLVLPVLIRAGFGKKVRCFANLGPYIGYLIQAKGPYVPITYSPNPNETYIFTDNYAKKIDFGFTAGIGLTIPLGDKLAISLEARNDLSLQSFLENSPTKLNTTNLLVGFSYGIK